mmetsp:Transcript_14190/g.32160  ORF Transcript_14190/g.32160 Transcript_14190/m.32160 type:complete len:425 (-) Transcript_14190:59-1333(-)
MALACLRELFDGFAAIFIDEVVEEVGPLVFEVPVDCPVQVPCLELLCLVALFNSPKGVGRSLRHVCLRVAVATVMVWTFQMSFLEVALALALPAFVHACTGHKRVVPPRSGTSVVKKLQLTAGKDFGGAARTFRSTGGAALKAHGRASERGVSDRRNAALTKKVASLELLASRSRQQCHTRTSTANATLSRPGVGISLDVVDASIHQSAAQRAAPTPEPRCKRDDQSYIHRGKEPIRRSSTEVSKPESPLPASSPQSIDCKSVGTKKSTSPQMLATPHVKTGTTWSGCNSQSSTPSDIISPHTIASDSSSCSDEEGSLPPRQDAASRKQVKATDREDAESSHEAVMQSLEKRRSVLAALRQPWQDGDIDGLTDALCSIRINGCAVLKEFLPRSRYHGTPSVGRKFTRVQAEQLQSSLRSFLLTM